MHLQFSKQSFNPKDRYKMNKIIVYTADGTLNMPEDQKEPFRVFAYEELKNAYTDHEIHITKKRSTKLFELESTVYIPHPKLHSFIKGIFDRWNYCKN